MIYIPFFIVILISKRGVREAERERERYEHITIQRTIHQRGTPRAHRAIDKRAKRYKPPPPPSTTQRKRGMTAPPHRGTPPQREEEKKRYGATPHHPPSRTPHLHTAYTHRTPRTPPPTEVQHRVPSRLNERTHTRLHTPTGAHRRGLGERHPSVTTPETTCDHPP